MVLINGQLNVCEPAVEAYIKDLRAKVEFWCKLHEEVVDVNTQYEETIKALKAENARLEEAFQKATGVIATDSLPTAVDLYKLKKMCIENQGCRECAFRRENFEGFDRCAFEGLPMNWNFGGEDNE